MSRTMVAYGPATPWPQEDYETGRQRAAAGTWAGENAAGVLKWFREGRTTLSGPIEERTRLHHALFCVRANFADDLWLTEWPSGWGAWDEALIQAVLAPRGGGLIVDGERFVPDDSDPQFVTARGWMGVLETLDPRLEYPSEDRPADIGAYLGVEEAARLAHKLRDDFRLSEAAIAEWLTTYDYTSTRGDSYSAGAVHAMLKRRDSDVDVERSQMPAGARTRPMPKLWAVSFGPAAEAMLPDLEAWNAQQREPVAAVGPIPGPDHSHVTVLDRPALLTLLRTAPLVSSVHLSAESDLADDEIQRMFLLALLDEHGAKVFIDGNEVRGWEERDEASRRTYLGARSAVRLHAILRAHDQGTVEDPSLTQDAAYNLARTIRDRAYQHSLKQAAMKLNEEAIPTKGRHGHWWADSVQALLGGRGR